MVTSLVCSFDLGARALDGDSGSFHFHILLARSQRSNP